jgi:hypothetical protein
MNNSSPKMRFWVEVIQVLYPM